ncbi:MAG: arylesterase [Pseudomonadota bacterium]
MSRNGLIKAAAIVLCVALGAVNVSAAPVRVLAFGDSLVAGYGLGPTEAFVPRFEEQLRALGVDANVIDAGVSGDTTAGGAARIDWALADEPDVALVELGGNDGLRGIDPRSTYANLDAILAALAEANVPTLFAGMLAPPNLGVDYETEFNAVFPALAEKHDVVFYPFFLDGVAGDPEFNQPDMIHPNADGVDVIVDRLAPLMAELIQGRASE